MWNIGPIHNKFKCFILHQKVYFHDAYHSSVFTVNSNYSYVLGNWVDYLALICVRRNDTHLNFVISVALSSFVFVCEEISTQRFSIQTNLHFIRTPSVARRNIPYISVWQIVWKWHQIVLQFPLIFWILPGDNQL